jgi:hypothetical protein
MAAIAEQAGITELRPAIAGRSPWALAWRRLRRNRIALAALGLFVLIVLLSLAAPLYAHDVAHDGSVLSPNLNGKTLVHGKLAPVMQQGAGYSSWARPRSARPGTSITTSLGPTASGGTSRRCCSMAGARRCRSG